MGRLTRDGTAETVSRDQILRLEQGQGNINFPCLADHKQDWQPYRLMPSLLHMMTVTKHTILKIVLLLIQYSSCN